MKLISKTSVLAAISLFTGFLGQASASIIAGNYSYSYNFALGSTPDGSCTAGTRDHFAGTGTNSIDGTDTISGGIDFSACNSTPGGIVGGLFSIDNGAGDSVSGFFSATANGTTIIGGNTYGVEEGYYTVTAAAGRYVGVLDGIFTAQTGPVSTPLQGTGFVELQSATPEPAAMALTGIGLLLAGFLHRRQKA